MRSNLPKVPVFASSQTAFQQRCPSATEYIPPPQQRSLLEAATTVSNRANAMWHDKGTEWLHYWLKWRLTVPSLHAATMPGSDPTLRCYPASPLQTQSSAWVRQICGLEQPTAIEIRRCQHWERHSAKWVIYCVRHWTWVEGHSGVKSRKVVFFFSPQYHNSFTLKLYRAGSFWKHFYVLFFLWLSPEPSEPRRGGRWFQIKHQSFPHHE